jgi:DNA-binding CsgD family transcriptional regulator
MDTIFHTNAYVYFTRREEEIIKFLNAGFSSQEIADKLFISKNTVDTHRRNLLRKKRSGSRPAFFNSI